MDEQGYEFVIMGQTPSKKRHWSIGRTRRSGKPIIYLDKEYKEWESSAASQLWVQKCNLDLSDPIDDLVDVSFRIYLSGDRWNSDLTNLIQSCEDALVLSGVLKDDCLIMGVDGSRKLINVQADRERTEIWIRPFKRAKVSMGVEIGSCYLPDMKKVKEKLEARKVRAAFKRGPI